MLDLAPGTLAVHRLTTHATVRDTFALRLALERVLGAADIAPRGMGPEQILFIRRLSDPMPGTISPTDQPAPPGLWERATSELIERLARHAVRPLREVVPAGAEAVLFADRAEMLASLAVDRMGGTTSSRWWWACLAHVRRRPLDEIEEWLTKPSSVPAALTLLADLGQAEQFVSGLPAPQAAAVLSAIITTFGLTHLETMFSAAAAREAAWEEASAPHNLPSDRSGSAVGAPWDPWVPEAGPGLDGDRRMLIAVGLLLLRSPGTVRSESFARSVGRWRETQTLADASSSRSPASGERGRPNPDSSGGGRSHPQVVATRGPPEVGGRAGVAASEASSTTPTGPGEGFPAQAGTGAPTFGIVRGPELTSSATIPDRPGPPAHASTLPAGAWPWDGTSNLGLEAVATEIGGLFYLLNLALRLGMYGDFTEPGHPGIDLDPWDFVTLIGGRLLDLKHGDPLSDDPIWTLLAHLAGRTPHTQPGGNFTPSRDWRVLASWIQGLPCVEPWTWNLAHGRLRICHPLGFEVVDVRARRRDATRVLRTELGAFDHTETVHRPMPGAPRWGSRARLWFDRLTPFVRPRLRLALGLDGDDEIASVLLLSRAEVIPTLSRVDVLFSLSDLPVAVRLSGLDRDPGWIPAAGRTVAFHFR